MHGETVKFTEFRCFDSFEINSASTDVRISNNCFLDNKKRDCELEVFCQRNNYILLEHD